MKNACLCCQKPLRWSWSNRTVELSDGSSRNVCSKKCQQVVQEENEKTEERTVLQFYAIAA